jgi:hypothetical protein
MLYLDNRSCFEGDFLALSASSGSSDELEHRLGFWPPPLIRPLSCCLSLDQGGSVIGRLGPLCLTPAVARSNPAVADLSVPPPYRASVWSSSPEDVSPRSFSMPPHVGIV